MLHYVATSGGVSNLLPRVDGPLKYQEFRSGIRRALLRRFPFAAHKDIPTVMLSRSEASVLPRPGHGCFGCGLSMTEIRPASHLMSFQASRGRAACFAYNDITSVMLSRSEASVLHVRGTDTSAAASA